VTAPSDIDSLKLAFTVSSSLKVIEADERIDYQELKFYGQIFPRGLLRDFGFLDDEDNYTAAFEEAQQRALTVLPQAISTEEKLELITLIHGASMADDDLGEKELVELRRAGDLLGLSPAEFTNLIAALSLEPE
jgi:uncharacterized tellurite resistance protein B-like protein